MVLYKLWVKVKLSQPLMVTLATLVQRSSNEKLCMYLLLEGHIFFSILTGSVWEGNRLMVVLPVVSEPCGDAWSFNGWRNTSTRSRRRESSLLENDPLDE